MKIRLILSVLLCFISLYCFSQNITIKGQIQDFDKNNLVGAVAITLNPKDSVLISYAVTDDNGIFVLPNINLDKVTLQITYISYGTIERVIDLDKSNKVMDLGVITMSSESKLLDQVTVTAEYVPIKITRDTIEYSADAFKTQPNAVVEELLKKLPGVEVDANGGIKVQGEDVVAVTVDGKDFFGKDPKMATRNLPASAIKKIQVFDKKSKSAQFTGVDDGQEEKTINLELKDNMKGGYFGNVTGGYGTNDRYEGKLMLNQFNKKTQISLIGSLNNLNNSGVNVNDYVSMTSGSGSNNRGANFNSGAPISFGQSNTGEITSATAGINLNYDFGKKNLLNISYFLTNSNTNLVQTSKTNNFQQTKIIISNKALESTSGSLNHNIYSKIDLKIDSSSEMTITNTLAINNSDNTSSQLDTTLNAANIILNLNNQDQTNTTSSTAYSGQINYRKKLQKKGRSFTLDGSYGSNTSQLLNDLLSEVYDENAVLNIARSVFQFQSNNTNGTNYSTGGTFTEPLSTNWFLVLNTGFRNNNTDLAKDFYYLDPNTKTIGDLNTELSRIFDNSFNYFNAGSNFRFRNKNINTSFGVDFQQSTLNGFPSVGAAIQRNFPYWLPKASIEFENTSLRINYNTSIKEPTIDQLQPIVDNSDPLNLYIGNPELVPEYRHNMRLIYHFFDQFNFRSMFASVRMGYTQNKITTASVIDDFFVRRRTPLNTDHEASVSSNISYSSPINQLKSKFRASINSSLTNGINFVNSVQNNIDRWNNGFSFTFENKSKEKFDASISTNWTFTNNVYKDNEALNTSFVNQTYEAYLALFPGKGWTLDSRFEYRIYGQGSFGESTNYKLWQSSISKSLMNNLLTIKIRAFDILNQNRGINRSASETFITESISNTIGRYFMLSAAYSLNAMGTKPQENRNIMIMRH